MKFKVEIEIEMNNAAFENDEAGALLLILDYLREKIEYGADLRDSVVYLHDTNGNMVGTAKIEK